MSKGKKPSRRSFLKGAAAGAAASVAKPAMGETEPSQAQVAATGRPAAENAADVRPASDYIVDIFKSLGIEAAFALPAGNFAGIIESVVHYGGNKNPEWHTCMHEESSVAMANGYAKIEGKPALVCAHSTVGL
jgi:hypothetical protein